jgi:succinate dehydrogenase / fumarate reductase, cytochrome b subunit
MSDAATQTTAPTTAPTTAGAHPRPLSPHLTIWKWGPHMAVSIAHRMSGIALATLGAITLTLWLLAIANGRETYFVLQSWLQPWYGKALLIIISWAFFQHLLSGLRHFVLDVGAGYELRANKRGSIAVFIGAVVLTAALWGYFLYLKG